MLSYEYCHFEAELPLKEEHDSLEKINALFKDAQRLCEERVRQFQKKAADAIERERAASQTREEAYIIGILTKPPSERTPHEIECTDEFYKAKARLAEKPYEMDDDVPF